MNISPTSLPGVVVIEPRVFADQRGFFLETFQRQRFQQAGLPVDFVQYNHSRSTRGTLRGLHYQIEHPQGKLVQVVRGEIYDVVVDLRRSQPTFGQWIGIRWNDRDNRQLYVPPGFAHGFCVLSDVADVIYGCTDYYHPAHERTILWNDPTLAIDWPIMQPTLSSKDQQGYLFPDAEMYE